MPLPDGLVDGHPPRSACSTTLVVVVVVVVVVGLMHRVDQDTGIEVIEDRSPSHVVVVPWS